jgi:hypothetical protein
MYPEFSRNWQQFQKKFTIFIKFLQKQNCDVNTFTHHAIVPPPLAALPVVHHTGSIIAEVS